MPEFKDVASYFDDIETRDGYTGTVLFLAQFNTFDESSMDGSITKKRTMSTRPEITPPVRRVIEALGERWIVGDGNIDGFRGVAVRANYWTKKATHYGQAYTPGQLLVNGVSEPIWLNMDYLKDTVNGLTDSEYDPFWEIYVAPVESVVRGTIFKIGNKLYRVRTEHVELSGLRSAQSDELDYTTLVTASYQTGVYDRIEDTWSGPVVTKDAIMLDMYQLYEYRTDFDPKMHSGDRSLITVDTIPVGRIITIAGEQWTVQATQPHMDAYLQHIRKN